MSDETTGTKPQRLQNTRFPGFYVCFVAFFQDIARAHGYALAFHGSMATDFDLLCVPWIDGASEPQALIDAFAERLRLGGEDDGEVMGPSAKPHGRLAWTLVFGGQAVFDISITPMLPPHTRA